MKRTKHLNWFQLEMHKHYILMLFGNILLIEDELKTAKRPHINTTYMETLDTRKLKVFVNLKCLFNSLVEEVFVQTMSTCPKNE